MDVNVCPSTWKTPLSKLDSIFNSFNLTNTFYDLIDHKYMSPDSHMKLVIFIVGLLDWKTNLFYSQRSRWTNIKNFMRIFLKFEICTI